MTASLCLLKSKGNIGSLHKRCRENIFPSETHLYTEKVRKCNLQALWKQYRAWQYLMQLPSGGYDNLSYPADSMAGGHKNLCNREMGEPREKTQCIFFLQATSSFYTSVSQRPNRKLLFVWSFHVISKYAHTNEASVTIKLVENNSLCQDSPLTTKHSCSWMIDSFSSPVEK